MKLLRTVAVLALFIAATSLTGCGEDEGAGAAATQDAVDAVKDEITKAAETAPRTSDDVARKRMLEVVEAVFVALMAPTDPPVANERESFDGSMFTLERVAYSRGLAACVYEASIAAVDTMADEGWRVEGIRELLSKPVEAPITFAPAHKMFIKAYKNVAKNSLDKLAAADRMTDLKLLYSEYLACAA